MESDADTFANDISAVAKGVIDKHLRRMDRLEKQNARLRELLLEVLTFPHEYDSNEWAKLMDKLRDATAEDGDGTMP